MMQTNPMAKTAVLRVGVCLKSRSRAATVEQPPGQPMQKPATILHTGQGTSLAQLWIYSLVLGLVLPCNRNLPAGELIMLLALIGSNKRAKG